MYVDLLTLYFLAIGTLLASAGLTVWESKTNPPRRKELRILAVGYATLALGCVGVILRSHLPGISGGAICNLVFLSGYLLILDGVAMLGGRQYRAFSVGLVVAMALIWVGGGPRWQDVVWNYVSAFPIAIASGLTAREMLRCEGMETLHSRHIVVAATAIHAGLYLFRAIILPWLVLAYGPQMQALASKATLYEGVLYSVILPMTLLKLIREESHGHLLRESRTDYLTRLGNRRWFFEEGARVIARRGGQGPIAVLAFDLDQFKGINDLYGHKTGDHVLRAFAEIAQSVLGHKIVLARIGGEEFAALLVGHDALRAESLGDTVGKYFSEIIATGTAGIALRATVSVGLARYEKKVPDLMDILSAADQALYSAKSMGGNRLEVAPPGLALKSA
ncbi:GGDEF domain-containing protein [Bordetella genomosp. 10]|uniref:diguanylate cyclase n=1 Tax=Bordetella genomosp. 10 TaxID=1416804 RepID=A0A261SM61_9BORD|nr:GGDEF domain-containing protein [Bordetella genomosp. 10]OZI38524.1 GGDEF domain-containing protein [Bordetella genomosp. 10]